MPSIPFPDPAFPDVSQVVAEMRKAHAGGKGRRSALYRWLRDNHERLSEEFDRIGPAWEALAAALGANGVLDGRRNKPTARGARDAWYRVREDMRLEQAKRDAGPKKPVGDLAPGVRSVPAPALTPLPLPAIQEDQAEAEEPEFRVATPRGWTPPVPPAAGSAPTPSPMPERRNPDEAIARLLNRPKHNSMPMPTVPEPEDD